jgi:hypothetical protein
VGLMILYHDLKQPDRAGMTMIAGQSDGADVIAYLEAHGSVIDKITLIPERRLLIAITKPL